MTSKEENINLAERLSILFNNDYKLNAACKNIALDIENGKIHLFKVVEELGDFFTNVNATVRERGVRLLSIILINISKNFLNEHELQLMTTFYCDRINDHHNIIPAVISGILAIVQMHNLPKDSPSKIFHVLFRNIRCQSELQETRRNIYSIIRCLFFSRIEDLKLLGPDFIYGIISSIDGENDPRNLMILFHFLPYFMKELNLYHLIEEMFEVIACYFPVDFNSNAKDGREITRDDLANALELCLSAIPQFAQYCLPLIIEKLNTNLKIAKIDALRLLVRCSTIFEMKDIENHLDNLWPLIKNEVLSSSDQEIKEEALKSITAVIRVISESETILMAFVETIIADTKMNLCDVRISFYWPTEKLLETVSKANDKACLQILKNVVALCLAQYTLNISIIDKISLIKTLNNFLEIYTGFGLNISDISELSWVNLSSLYLNELSSMNNNDAHILRAKLIDGLGIQKASLAIHQRQTLYEKICIEIDRGDDSTKRYCQSALIRLAQLYPDEVYDIINRQLTFDDVEISILKNRIETLTIIGRTADLGSRILPILVNLIVCSKPKISFVTLYSIKKLLMSAKSEYNIHYFLYHNCTIMEKLIHSTFEDGLNEKLHKLQHLISSICWLITQKLSADHQQNVIEKYLDFFEVNMADNILLLEGLLTPLLPCNITKQITNLFMQLFEISVGNIDEIVRSSSCRLAAVIINKMNEDDNFNDYLDFVEKETKRILNTKQNLKHKQATVIFHTWITKALIVKGNRKSHEFLNQHHDLLRNKLIGKFTGENYRIFVDKNDNTLVRENFCLMKIFYKQRIFQSIMDQDETFINSARHNYLIALMHIVEEMPMEVLFMHLVKLVPLLIESLSLSNVSLILSTLKILNDLLDTKNNIFVEQIQSFISWCLELSTHPKMHIRIAAINCLNSYCNYSVISIKLYKDDVLEKLKEAIDDRKRLVRQTAVTARVRWYLVGALGALE